MPRVLLVLIVVAVTVYALVQAAQADGARVRLMPKWLWVVAILCLPGAGAIAWFALGLPRGGGDVPGGVHRRPIAPDDDPDFLRRL